MHEEQITTTWIERCARRLQLRHTVAPTDAMELASAMHEELGGETCPERAAEALFASAELH